MKTKLLLTIGMTFLFLMSSLGGSLAPVSAQADGPDSAVLVETQADGRLVEGIGIGSPLSVEVAAQMDTAPLPKGGMIANFPAYKWVLGTSAAAAGMIAAYYDTKAYTNLSMGPKNGGKMPLTDTGWATWSDGSTDYPNNPLIASHKGIDGRASRGTLDDYWIVYDSPDKDPYITGGWAQHSWSTAIGDYMKTSQSKYLNRDGFTWFFYYQNDSSRLTCDVMEDYYAYGFKISVLDGTYGRKLFYEKRGYSVTDCYNQYTDNVISGGFSLTDYKKQIDAGHPVVINLRKVDGTGARTIAGYGYNGSTIYIRDGLDNDPAHVYSLPWGGSYLGSPMYSVSIVRLGPAVVPNPKTPAYTITDTTPTFSWSKVGGASDYRFRLYKVGVSTPLYTKTVTAAAACGSSSTCTNTPTKVLVIGQYKWQVQAKVGGVWKAYSDFRKFTLK